MATTSLTQERLMSLVSYDAETGVFTWRITRRNCKTGAVAGSLLKGYLRISIDSKIYAAHRLAWLYTYGCWPSGEIDHINRVRNDNRLCNLREATRELNTQNANVRVDSPYGIRGVTKHKYSNKYRARIQANKKAMLLGLFDTPEEAAAAYAAAAAKLHAQALVIGV
jgi:hypothetical protein